MTDLFLVINDNNIQEYINSLPDNEETISLENIELTFIPDLSRFVNLKYLYCGQTDPPITLFQTKLNHFVLCFDVVLKIRTIMLFNNPNLACIP